VAQKIFIFGRGGHARVIADIIDVGAKFEVEGYVDAGAESSQHHGRPLYEEDYFLDSFHGENVVIAVGENVVRKRIFEKIKDKGFRFPNVIHPSAIISKTVTMAHGNVIMANVVINPSSTIGNFCVLNTSSVLEHDCEIDDFVSLAPRSVVCGNCRLKEGVYVGSNASIIHSKTVLQWSVVASQAAVISDVPAFKMVAGVPAKIIKTIEPGKQIL
jgi:acetyltransferase EpsM